MKPKGSILGTTLAFAAVIGAGLWSAQIQAQSVSFAVNPYGSEARCPTSG